MPDATVRPADPALAPDGVRVSFADGFPFLLISEESLADLNSRLAQPLPTNRFRPNLVIAGGEPHVEDALERCEIDGITSRVVKPCGRWELFPLLDLGCGGAFSCSQRPRPRSGGDGLPLEIDA